MHILQWEKVGILSWLMGKWVENIMILQVGSEKLRTKMEGFGCFTGHFKDFFEDVLCVCLFVSCNTIKWLYIVAVLYKENNFIFSCSL